MFKSLLMWSALPVAAVSMAAAQADVRVEPPTVQGPRQLADQTAKAAVQNYLQAWESMRTALGENRADVLSRDFVGSALEKLTGTVQQQNAAGLRSEYQDRSHDIQIVFYSPEGLSIELTDHVSYDQQLIENGKVVATQHVKARYVAVLTPTEVRWRVRILQASPE